MDYKHRSILDSLPNYKQGKPAPALDGIRAYKISSNENPFEPLESVKDAISNRALGVINRYPNMRGTEVVEELAKKFSVTPNEVVLGCGSTEVITQLVDLVAGPGDEVIYLGEALRHIQLLLRVLVLQALKFLIAQMGRTMWTQ